METNGPLGAGRWSTFTCGTFPFLATCYQPSKPHVVTVTWPDGHVERFRFAPNPGSQLIPTITTAGFTAEPGTSSTLQAIGDGLLLSNGDFLLGDFFSADGIYDPTQFVLSDLSGTKSVVTGFTYEAFGTPRQSGSLVNPFRYLCLYYYAVAGLMMGPSGPYDPGSGRSLSEDQVSPAPNPYQGFDPASPPSDGGFGGRSGGSGALGGGDTEASGGYECTGNGPKIYPKGWKKFEKQAKKMLERPKSQHPKKGAGTEYVSVLPSQELIQDVADFGFMIRCQFNVAANSLAG